jgi:7-cyano-7-deazaguanine synthase
MKSVVLLSGGLDSAVALADAKAAGEEVILALGFKYGSRHNQWENLAAAKVAGHYGVPFWLEDLSGTTAFAAGGDRCALMKGGPKVPEGHYEAESMRLTVVPGRNLILLAHAASVAERLGAGKVVIGIHAGDHFIYPDCRPAFYTSATNAVQHGSDGKVFIEAPFLKWNKIEIVKRGLELRVPFQLTRTCYSDRQVACGRCGSCQERLTAFAANATADPLEYETRELLPKA